MMIFHNVDFYQLAPLASGINVIFNNQSSNCEQQWGETPVLVYVTTALASAPEVYRKFRHF